MKKIIEYFYPKHEVSFFERLKTNFFVIIGLIGSFVTIISLQQDFTTIGNNFFISLLSKITMLLVLGISLIVLKKRGIKTAGNIFSITMVVMLLIWMNILKEDISPFYKYMQGFYSVFAVLIMSMLFASRRVIIINAVLILATTTRIYFFTTAHEFEGADFFTIGYISHTSVLIIITVILYFSNKFAESAIEKAKQETAIKEKQNLELAASEDEIRASNEELLVTTSALRQTNKELINAIKESDDSKAKFKQLSDLTFEGIIIHDNGVAVDINLSLAKMFKYTTDEIIGKNTTELFFHKNYHNTIYKNIKKNYTLPYEVVGIKKGGELFHVELETRNVELGNNKTFRVAAIRDISLRKQAEEKLIIKNQELLASEEEIRATNEELMATSDALKKSNNELIIAKEKAEESDRLKTEFLNNMSHEVRTPLNGIMGFSQLLNISELSIDDRDNYIDIINDSGSQLLKIIDDIIEISRLGTKQVKVVENEVSLNNLITGLQADFIIKAKQKNIQFNIIKGLSDINSMVFTDKNKLNKIFSKLIDNALKFTNTGTVGLGYKLVHNANEKQHKKILFYVNDTGIGIAADKKEIIFNRFSQESNALSRKYGGLGLGLSIAKENIELLGGKISFYSETENLPPNKKRGTVFFVEIPYKPVGNSVETSELSVEKNEVLNGFKLNSDIVNTAFTILIVEDEDANYLYFKTLLEREFNCSILYVKNGKEAVDICKTKPEIDIVLMDLKMPVLDGYEATKQIRRFRSNLIIIAQTAYSSKEDKIKAVKYGCNDFISKPITKEAFYALIYKHLNSMGLGKK